MVTPCSLCVRVSPQQMMGVMPCSKALRTFLFTVSSVSAKYSLLSECPMITYFTPASSSIAGEISPVKAPFSSKYIFSAPIMILEPFAASIAGMMSIAGTHRSTSTSSFATRGFNVLISSTAWLGVIFIFQLPAMIFFLAIIIHLLFLYCVSHRMHLCLQAGSNTFRGKALLFLFICRLLLPRREALCLPGTPGKHRHR